MKKHLFLLLIIALALVMCSCSCRHEAVILEAVPATCEQTGLTEGTQCSKCGEVLTAQEIVPALGHTYTLDAQIDPTCTQPGAAPGFSCSVCGEVFVPQEEIPALGEKFDPDVHTAVMRAEEGEPGTVLEVFQKGYRIKNRVIRYAMVKVSAE